MSQWGDTPPFITTPKNKTTNPTTDEATPKTPTTKNPSPQGGKGVI